MTPQAALIELLGRVGAGNGEAVFLNQEELSQWPVTAVAAMKSQKLFTKARPAVSVVCIGCERECVMPVHDLPTTRSPAPFIVCDKRSDINRVAVSTDRLTQWRCDAHAVCGFVAGSLGLRASDQHPANGDLMNIGMARGDKRSQMLALRVDGRLSLVIGNNAVPLAELVDFDDGAYSLDVAIVRQMVDAATPADPRYTPTIAKREARKLDTQTMYERWQKAYRALRKRRPNMSDVWYSEQIAKTDVALGRDAGTIKKNMKS